MIEIINRSGHSGKLSIDKSSIKEIHYSSNDGPLQTIDVRLKSWRTSIIFII